MVIDGVEDPSEYSVLLEALLDDLNANGPMETLLIERIAQLFWRLRRVLRFETERLSQSQRELMPVIADLNEMVRERSKRDRMLDALGKLFLPGEHVFSSETVSVIFDACASVLPEHESSIFRDSVRDSGSTDEDVVHTVRTVLGRIRKGEASLQSAGATVSNLPARAYEYLAGIERAWGMAFRSGDAGRERQRTEALLLEIERANIIEKYEPRLRRDLSRTFHDLLELQARRGAARSAFPT